MPKTVLLPSLVSRSVRILKPCCSLKPCLGCAIVCNQSPVTAFINVLAASLWAELETKVAVAPEATKIIFESRNLISIKRVVPVRPPGVNASSITTDVWTEDALVSVDAGVLGGRQHVTFVMTGNSK